MNNEANETAAPETFTVSVYVAEIGWESCPATEGLTRREAWAYARQQDCVTIDRDSDGGEVYSRGTAEQEEGRAWLSRCRS